MENKSENPSPEVTASRFSKSNYAWVNSLFKLGTKRPLQLPDLFDVNLNYSSKVLKDEFEKNWNRQHSSHSGAFLVLKTLFKSFGYDFWLSAFYLALHFTLCVVSPVLLQILLVWIKSTRTDGSSDWIGYGLAVSLFVVQILSGYFFNWQLELSQRTGFKIRTSLTSMLYEKMFKMSPSSREFHSVGRIINVTTTDTQRLDLATHFIHMLWQAPILILVVFGFLYINLGVSSLFGLALVVFYIPFQWWLAEFLGRYRRRANVWSDKRMKVIHESLKGIRVIKAYAWEKSFLDLILSLREKEMQQIVRFLSTRAATSCITQTIPSLALLASLLGYVYMGNELDATKIIPSLALFYALRIPMLFLPITLNFAIDSWVALGRIAAILQAEEYSDQPTYLKSSTEEAGSAIELKDATFAWDDSNGTEEPFKLENMNLEIPTGKLVVVIGEVAAGKSSLLSAMIGDMKKTSGEAIFHGSIAYCQQQAWIQNATVRENILFGAEYEPERYAQVIKACALERDLSILTGGDLAEIGENGINISGGQKQRISLARAVYNNADIYLLDDPLSAVDSHVGKVLFEDCISNQLKGKTRILVTHQLHFISRADIIIMIERGKVVCKGSFDQLMATDKSFQSLLKNYNGSEEEEVSEDIIQKVVEIEQKVHQAGLPQEKGGEILTKIEDQNKGTIAKNTISLYFWYGGGIFACILLGVWIIVANVVRIATDQWLVVWGNRLYSLSSEAYINLYIAIALSQLVFNLIYGISTATYGARASKKLHNLSIQAIFRSPISFFDQTPLGRITSRFSRDVDTLDTLLPESLRSFFWTLSTCVSNMILISYYLPTFLVPVAITFVLYYQMQAIYRPIARELKRIDSVTRSPIVANVSEGLSGIATIRSFGSVELFKTRFANFLDENNRAAYLILIGQRWVQLRLELMNSFLVLLASVLSIAYRRDLRLESTGIMITYAIQITATFTWTIKTGTDSETYFNCAERMIHYIREIESEKPEIIETFRPGKDWPSKGQIRFENVNMRYRSNLPLVLNDLSLVINAGEKVGIVGRTGAGKSTILSTLLRIVELESGAIIVDDLDISKMGLNDLRNKIAVIPQEPVLFAGTLRFNLDPFSIYTDDELWTVIKRINLLVENDSHPEGLETRVSDNGENWSTGQRQLICLARAMLKKSKIILLDEATASVDFVTDELIQKTIREDFADATVITIAHRLNTVADYDKIAVLSFGRLHEHGIPRELLSNPLSEFSRMVNETGDSNATIIRSIAFKN